MNEQDAAPEGDAAKQPSGHGEIDKGRSDSEAIGVAMQADRRMLYFELLTESERRAAIQRLADSGVSDYGISAACGLSVEMVRSILGERNGRCTECEEC